MRLLREVLLILISAGAGVAVVVAAFVAITFAVGLKTGGWEMALGMLVAMAFGPFIGTTMATRFLGLLFRCGESRLHSVVIALTLTGTLLALLDLAFSLNRNWGSAMYVGLALLGAAASALSVTSLNKAIAQRAQR